jgi:cytochrome oxidase Cu insertion factor (SCO1/SenC/PrrC family)
MLVRNPRGPIIRLAMIAAALGLFMVGYYWGNQYKHADRTPPTIEGVLVRAPPGLPGFELRDAENQPFTANSFEEHWSLVTFGDLGRAPGHLAVTRMIEVYNRLAERPELQTRLLIALVAERQDPALARDFARLSPALKLLSGDPGEVQRLRASLDAAPPENPGVDVGDDTAFYLIGPSSRLLALFPGAQPPAAIASDLTAIAEHPQSLHPNND